MTHKDIQEQLKKLQIEIDQCQDPSIQKTLKNLLNLIETLAAENNEIKEKNQKLKNEINRLKGEQGKPDIKPKKKKNADHSSEDERHNGDNEGTNEDEEDEPNPKKRKRNRKPKLPKITIDRKEYCRVDEAILPNDVIFKGYEEVVIQDIKITTDNVKYYREVYYSPSENKNYRGNLPDEIEGQGEYGVGIRTLIPLLKSECHMSEPCIISFFENFGIIISKTYVSTQWTKGYPLFHKEKEEIFQSGLASTIYQQVDDTGARVNGGNHHTHIFCNPYYSAFFTTPKKDRLTVLGILTHHAPSCFLYNEITQNFLNEEFQLSNKLCRAIHDAFEMQKLYNEAEFEQCLEKISTAKIGSQIKTRIKEAFAIAAYWKQTEMPVIEILMSDDAPQFKKITPQQILCWIHDGRHYKKLNPVVQQHQNALDSFLTEYWIYYHKLKKYKKTPTPEMAILLAEEFDRLFSTETHYHALNDRIQKTFSKKEELLLVLKYPEVPLHNNASELGARVQVRHRDVSLHTKSEEGTKIKDTFMTLSETAKKLGVRAYDYIYDRVSGAYKMDSLAEIIRTKNRIDNTIIP